MHYRNGDKAEVGHRLRFKAGQFAGDGKTWAYAWREGLVVALAPGCQTCNATVAYPVLHELTGVRVLRLETTCVTLGECDRTDLPCDGAPAGP